MIACLLPWRYLLLPALLISPGMVAGSGLLEARRRALMDYAPTCNLDNNDEKKVRQ